MCLTLPEVLVTVMGIEKLLPAWRDLEVFLQLLPRSSTAERMNPYTSLWTGVREDDGPQEFHLVLLDGGRTDVLADEVGRQALHCIRCSACLNVCPVYSRVGGQAYESVYPGPDRRDPDAAAARAGEAPSLPWASSLCGACYEVCPVKIDIPSVLVHLRGRVVREEKSSCTPEALAMEGMARAFASRAALRGARSGSRASAAGRSAKAAGARLDRDARPARDPRSRPSATGGASASGRAGEREDARGARRGVRAASATRSAAPAVPEVPRAYRARRALAAATASSSCFCESVAEYRATVHRSPPTTSPRPSRACGARGASAPRRLRRTRLEVIEDAAARVARARRARRRRHRLRARRSPRPGRSCSTAARRPAAAR